MGSSQPAGGPAAPLAGEETGCVGPDGEAPAEGAAGLRDRDGARGPPYGFNSHAALAGTIGAGEEADLQARTGATLWRVAIDWRFAEPEPGELSLHALDAIYCEGLARGIRAIFHITGAPDWAADPGPCPVEACIDPPRAEALDDLRDFAATVAERYPRAAAIEAWNEPNLATFWAEPDPERYVEVLAAIEAGVHSVDPEMTVLGGSLSTTRRSDETRYAFDEFLERIYAAGAARHMDGLAFHPYPIEPLDRPGERFTETMAELRRTMRAAGEGGEPIWVTEVGLPVGGSIGVADQARALSAIYRGLSADPSVAAVIFHTLLEGEAANGSGTGFGWLLPDGDGGLTPRPVYERFAG